MMYFGLFVSLCASQLVVPTLDPGLAAFHGDLSAHLDGAVDRSLVAIEQAIVKDASLANGHYLFQTVEGEVIKFKMTLLVHLESLVETELDACLDNRSSKEPLRASDSSALIGPLRQVWKQALVDDLSFWATTDLAVWVSKNARLESQRRALSDALAADTQYLETFAQRSGFEYVFLIHIVRIAKRTLANPYYTGRFSLYDGINGSDSQQIIRSIALSIGLQIYGAIGTAPAIASGLGKSLELLVRDRWSGRVSVV